MIEQIPVKKEESEPVEWQGKSTPGSGHVAKIDPTKLLARLKDY